MGDTSKRYKPEQIVSMRREAEIKMSKGQSIGGGDGDVPVNQYSFTPVLDPAYDDEGT